MDIAGLSIAMNQSKVMTELGTKMLAMNLDTLGDMGDALTASMGSMPSPSLESMVNPDIGGNIDIAV